MSDGDMLILVLIVAVIALLTAVAALARAWRRLPAGLGATPGPTHRGPPAQPTLPRVNRYGELED